MTFFTTRFATPLLLAFLLAVPASFAARGARACECARTEKCTCSKKGGKHDCAKEKSCSACHSKHHEEQESQHSEHSEAEGESAHQE